MTDPSGQETHKQGIDRSVATQLRCGGIFSDKFITHFPQNVPVKKF